MGQSLINWRDPLDDATNQISEDTALRQFVYIDLCKTSYSQGHSLDNLGKTQQGIAIFHNLESNHFREDDSKDIIKTTLNSITG